MLYEQELKEYKEMEEQLNNCSEFLDRVSINADMIDFSQSIYRELGFELPEGKAPSYSRLKSAIKLYEQTRKNK